MASGNTRSGQGNRRSSSAGGGSRTNTKNTNRRTQSGGRRTASSAGRKSNNRKKSVQEPALSNEILLIVSFAFCILLFLCNFSIMGPFGKTVKGVMFGMFGIVAYILPVVLFIGIALHISNEGNRAVRRKLIAGAVLIWCVGIAAQMISVPLADLNGNLIVDLFLQSRDGMKGGGLIGGLPAYPMMKYLKGIGSAFVLVVVILIALVIITERSFINGVKKGSRRVYDSARESAERHREERALRREEYEDEDYGSEEEDDEDREYEEDAAKRQRQSRRMQRGIGGRGMRVMEREDEDEEAYRAPRMEKKVSGVSEDTTLVKKRPETYHSENMHEITLDDIPDDEEMTQDSFEDAAPEEAFAFDLYRSMPEPRGMAQTPSGDNARANAAGESMNAGEGNNWDGAAGIAGESASTAAGLAGAVGAAGAAGAGVSGGMREITNLAAEAAEAVTTSGNAYKPQGADTFGAALESGYQPKKPEHSFGVKEAYRTPDQKKADAAVVPNVKPPAKPKKYIFPSLNLLKKSEGKGNGDSARQLKETAARLQQTLKTFGVNVTITDISQGPAVTRYEMQPELGVKVSKIVSLADDIKLNLAATDIRIEAPIPGKAAVGIEVPNKENSAVNLRELLESDAFRNFPSSIAFAVGKDIGGQTVVFDIGKMPHVLIAGSTGSGKSVCINTLIMSILYKAHPDDVKLIMVDPKVVELSVYNGIPHLLIPVVTDPKKASAALQWAVAEMTERYKKFADHNVRDLKGYNQLAESVKDSGDASAPVKMPQIVIIVDELADLMMVASNDVEEAIVRLAQLARAAGIHLVIATQRPSVDVITGLIKANMPSRVAFAVSSGVDSRTILDMNGAEKLLGKGDMLFYPQGYTKPARVQGAFVSDKEVSDVVDFLKRQAVGDDSGAQLDEKISSMTSAAGDGPAGGSASDMDELFAEAGRFIIEKDKASIGMVQRAFRVGFNRAARIMDQLADAGVVGEEEGTKPRKVLMSAEQFEQYIAGM
ncbi:MAG: DNA translocase FtsK [Lachnospiraceae bacterium]|nr:DNA translocase FtsK [Lachnospiraceae bacterium]